MSLTRLGRAGKLRAALALAVTVFCVTTGIAGPRTPDTVGPDVDGENIHVLHVRGNVYMLAGAGCNITVQVGEQFAIVVDTGLPQFTDELTEVIRRLTRLPILFLSNTTSDADHTGGDAKLYEAAWSLPNPDRVDLAPRKDVDKTHLILAPGGTIVTSLQALSRMDLPTGIKNDAVTFGREGLKLTTRRRWFSITWARPTPMGTPWSFSVCRML